MAMVTATALAAAQYCTVVLALALCARVFGRRHARVRQASSRILIVFGVFLAASAYVWLDLGPEVDLGFARLDQPLLIPAPRHFDI